MTNKYFLYFLKKRKFFFVAIDCKMKFTQFQSNDNVNNHNTLLTLNDNDDNDQANNNNDDDDDLYSIYNTNENQTELILLYKVNEYCFYCQIKKNFQNVYTLFVKKNVQKTKLVPSTCNAETSSFGIECARRAGLNTQLVNRARKVL